MFSQVTTVPLWLLALVCVLAIFLVTVFLVELYRKRAEKMRLWQTLRNLRAEKLTGWRLLGDELHLMQFDSRMLAPFPVVPYALMRLAELGRIRCIRVYCPRSMRVEAEALWLWSSRGGLRDLGAYIETLSMILITLRGYRYEERAPNFCLHVRFDPSVEGGVLVEEDSSAVRTQNSITPNPHYAFCIRGDLLSPSIILRSVRKFFEQSESSGKAA